jgi:hypothetical protein
MGAEFRKFSTHVHDWKTIPVQAVIEVIDEEARRCDTHSTKPRWKRVLTSILDCFLACAGKIPRRQDDLLLLLDQLDPALFQLPVPWGAVSDTSQCFDVTFSLIPGGIFLLPYISLPPVCCIRNPTQEMFLKNPIVKAFSKGLRKTLVKRRSHGWINFACKPLYGTASLFLISPNWFKDHMNTTGQVLTKVHRFLLYSI